MANDRPLNIFYAEPDPDRWIKFDHYPRRIIRRLVRGKPKPGGVMMVALNLLEGLKKIGIPYRFNDYKYIKAHPNEIACIIGKPQVLFDRKWPNPIIFGAGIYSHPLEYPDLFDKYPHVKRILVPGEWMRQMFEPYYGHKVLAWPVGIDTNAWKPVNGNKKFDFLIYNKILWNHERHNNDLIIPVISALAKHNLSHQNIKYGAYTHAELKEKLGTSKAVIFLCEHETQGQAYQQILTTNTPILAWDSGGYWQDPFYYPHKVQYRPVTPVPYWDGRCGVKFTGVGDFEESLKQFLVRFNSFKPRDYIMENLTLEICAEKYMKIYREVEREVT